MTLVGSMAQDEFPDMEAIKVSPTSAKAENAAAPAIEAETCWRRVMEAEAAEEPAIVMPIA